MSLSLNYAQRLNLIAVLGAQETKGREQHAIYHLQDTLDLDESEKEAIRFRQENVNGSIVQYWDTSKSLPIRVFDLGEIDLARIRRAVDEYPRFVSTRDRVWLEPLFAQLPEVSNNNKS